MSFRKLLFGLLILALVLMPITGCQKTTLTPIELVPQRANLIANIQISKIVNDQDIRDVYDRAEKSSSDPQTVEEALDEIVEETGVNLHDFSQVMVFADITNIGQSEYIGAIAKGTFDEKQFIDNIEEKSGEEFHSSDYKDNILYTDDREEVAIAFLGEKTLLVGTVKAVKDTIDVNEGDRESIASPVIDAYKQLGDALIKLALELPEEAKEALSEETDLNGIPISFEPFTDIDVIGFALDKEKETINLRIDSHFLSTDSAQDAQDTLSGAISLFKGLLDDPEIKELLEKLEVMVTDSCMTISFDIELSKIEELMESFQ